MDTRSKIVSMEQALALGAPVKAVVGFFDPLLAAHARRMNELASPGVRLMAVVLNPPDPLLNLQARAELAAGLAIIDFVVPVEGDARDFLERLAPIETIREERADGLQNAQFMEHVQRRYQLE